MANVTGTGGNDFVHVAGDGLTAPAGYTDNHKATDQKDNIQPLGGTDIIHAGGGNDTILTAVGNFSAGDQFDGGDGFDELAFSGGGNIVLSATSISNIEQINLNGNNVSLTTVDANVAAGQILQILVLTSSGFSTFDGSAETDGRFLITAPHHATGGAGDDIFRELGFATYIDGGAGFDTIEIRSGNPIDFDFASITVKSIERIALSSYGPGNTVFSLTSGNEMVAAGATLLVGASPAHDPNYSSHGYGYTLNFDGSAETDGRFDIHGGMGDDDIIGGAGDDIIREIAGSFDQGGSDSVNGGAGADLFLFKDTYSTSDSINGGDGHDRVYLNGDYSGAHALTFGPATMTNVEELRLHGAFDYSLTTDDATVAAAAKLLVNATPLSAGHALTFDGSAETDGELVLRGSAGDDALTGGLRGDMLTGNGGADHFTYTNVMQSTSALYDRIDDFNAGTDKFDLDVTVADIDATVTGALSKPTLNADLRAAFTASTLASGHAALLDVTSGGLSGHTFLVVDANGIAGYQTHGDYVFDVTGMSGSLAASDFI